MKYLASPFYDNVRKLHIYEKELNNLFPFMPFKMYTRSDRLLPFMLPYLGTCDFTINIRDAKTHSVFQSISSDMLPYTIVKKGTKRYIMYKGDKINCLSLDECAAFYIQFDVYCLEVFFASDDSRLTKFEFGNEYNVGDIPYQLGFKQWFWADFKINPPEQISTQVVTTDEKGNTTVSYSKLTDQYNFTFSSVPFFIKELFCSAEVLTYLSITQGEKSINCIERRATCRATKRGVYNTLFDVNFSILADDFIESGYCVDDEIEVDIETCGNTQAVIAKDCPDELEVTVACADENLVFMYYVTY